ncbi:MULTISPECIES: SRPBCC family protein [Legionella]|uniref:Activator of Hsp90 ATPase homologue 1/2-like C-terminal domain-containing protein n=1 Tax=Legionella steelei TaxID=947033 RepID=A0A0W0ZPI8_9GAMM|nr:MULTISPECIES: SRPBCC family protein [Legionella]KTD71085.1 hypothetical protein Lste_0409 [Legionella steelei]MBN9225880.1 SRPBCC family protein [Legionella steelei]OJW07854.1 MAG: hypothetical protein BGO44_14550 [Legionella sp. 39-23]
MNKPQFVYTTYIQTTAEKLWEALTKGEFTQQYWNGFRVESDWHVGSPMKFYAPDGSLAHSDKVLRADKPKVLSYSWKPIMKGMPDEPASMVIFELEPEGNLVKLTVTHCDFPDNSEILPMISNGWPLVLSSLKSFLETGIALTYSFKSDCSKQYSEKA